MQTGWFLVPALGFRLVKAHTEIWEQDYIYVIRCSPVSYRKQDCAQWDDKSKVEKLEKEDTDFPKKKGELVCGILFIHVAHILNPS